MTRMSFESIQFEIYETECLVPLGERYRRPYVEWITMPSKSFGIVEISLHTF